MKVMNTHEAVNYFFMETSKDQEQFPCWIQTVRGVQTKPYKQTGHGAVGSLNHADSLCPVICIALLWNLDWDIWATLSTIWQTCFVSSKLVCCTAVLCRGDSYSKVSFPISLSQFVLLLGDRKIRGLNTLRGGRTSIRKETFKEGV